MSTSHDDFSLSMPVVTILPITSFKQGRTVYPNEVLLRSNQYPSSGLKTDSLILAHQIRTISKERLIKNIGNIEEIEIQENINSALRIHLNL
jgi:mRNA interferase MazF